MRSRLVVSTNGNEVEVEFKHQKNQVPFLFFFSLSKFEDFYAISLLELQLSTTSISFRILLEQMKIFSIKLLFGVTK